MREPGNLRNRGQLVRSRQDPLPTACYKPPPSMATERKKQPRVAERASVVASSGDVTTAMEALEAAATSAERGVELASLGEIVRVGGEAFVGAARLDAPAVRMKLDRVIMGEDPEQGLDS